ncbi:MAG: arylsulfatase [Verrucomicrobiales bacterium]|nr:arylsulfatase [Verrucomicrobiales bacterium]
MHFRKSLATAFLFLATAFSSNADDRPNVILMMTDDQGIGDFGVNGNDVIETPNIDKIAANSGSLTTFYVSPVCSPTRASLMTGRYNQRTRCIDTWLGRSMMDTDEYTIAEALSAAGYRTGLFGKWHLGDCYPMRPQDQGFDDVLMHRGGGLAQPSEPLENNRRYTDPILFDEAGEAVQTKGFCTDVYFDAAMKFIDEPAADKKDAPFFIYLPTNAPHGPYHDVPEDLRKHYMKKDLESLMVNVPKNPGQLEKSKDQLARICAMITNEDQNVGRLIEHLTAKGLLENTIVIRMNDNGPNGMRFVGERRGMKSHIHEGGIRSPMWMHWPARVKAGTTHDGLAAHIDIMPTILEATGAKAGPNALDGTSFLPLLVEGGKRDWPKDRQLVIQSHRGTEAREYHHFMIRQGDWKLLHASGFGVEKFTGEPKFELYNLKADPKENRNLVAEKPEVFAKLKKQYEDWFADVSSTRPNNYAPPLPIVGTEHENPTVLTRQDWLGESWRVESQGHWIVEVANAGKANVKVIFHPDLMSGDDVTVTLKIGDETHQAISNAGTMEFEGIELPEGEVRIEASQGDGDSKVGAWHVELSTR